MTPSSDATSRGCASGSSGVGWRSPARAGSVRTAPRPLVRAGVGRLILADHDRVELSNLNRQAFFHDQAGLSKVEALAANLRRIHPRVDLDLNEIRLDRDNLIEVMGGADLLVEALDDARAKAEIIETWMRSCPGKPVVGASGLAGYGASDAIGITRMGRLVVVGDGTRDCSEGLCAGRVMAVAALQANEAIALLMGCGDAQKPGAIQGSGRAPGKE